MLRRSFLKACSAVSAMSVLGGVQAVANNTNCRTFVDLYADWALSKHTNIFRRYCEVNDVCFQNTPEAFVNLAQRRASMDEHSRHRIILVIRSRAVWVMGRIRNEWGYGPLLAKKRYHESVCVLRNFVDSPIANGLKQKTINIPGIGDVQIKQGEVSASNGVSKAVLLCLGGDPRMGAEVVLSDNFDDDLMKLGGIDCWYGWVESMHYRA